MEVRRLLAPSRLVAPAALLLFAAAAQVRGSPEDPPKDPAPKGSSPSPGAAAPTRADLDRALARGVAFLLAAQRPDGGWISREYTMSSPGHKTAITAVAMEAVLAGSGASPDGLESVRKAVGFLETAAPELAEGKHHDGFDFNGWGPAFGLRHLAGVRDRWPAKTKAPDLQRLVDAYLAWAQKNRHPCGGWSYLTAKQDPRFAKDGSVSFLTGVMIEGIARWDAKSALLAPAAEDLAKSADRDGRAFYAHGGDWTEPPRSPQESAGRTLQAALVLAGLGKKTADDVEARLAAFLASRAEYVKTRNSHAHAPPHYIAGYYYHHAHSYAARALRWLAAREKSPSPARSARVAELLGALVSEQDSEGAWLDAPCGDRPYATALAVLELTDLRELLFPWAATFAGALEAAKAGSVPVVVLFADAGKDAVKAEETLAAKDLDPVRDRCLWVRVPKDEAATWKAAKVAQAGTMLVLTAASGFDVASPAARLAPASGPKVVLRALQKALAPEEPPK